MKPENQASSVPVSSPIYNDPLFKKIFYGSLGLMLLLLWIFGYNSGVHTDEMDVNAYSKANIAFYTSGLKDTSFTSTDQLHDGTHVDRTMPCYGSGFEYLAIGLNNLVGNAGKYDYNVRHALNQLFAVFGLLFAGLIARRLHSYKASVFAIWLMFLTPTFIGYAVFDTKDIPFLTGYTASLYFIMCFISELPSPSWKTTLYLMLTLWFVMSVRIGAVILFSYLFLFGFIALLRNKAYIAQVKDWGMKLAVVIAGAFILTILIWPFAFRNPANVMEAIRALTKFPQRIPLIFEGEFIDSLRIPADYLPKSFFITVPVITGIAILFSLLYLFLTRKQRVNNMAVLLIGFAGVFPMAYAIYSHMPVYNQWRHLLFIYPALMAVTGIALATLTNNLKKPVLQWSVVVVLIAGLVGPVSWVAKADHIDRSYSYFNEYVGGFKGAYANYETDPWEMTVKTAVDWLFANDPAVTAEKDSIIIATNNYSFVRYYVGAKYGQYKKVRVVQCGVRGNFGMRWNYAIFHMLFLEPSYLENSFPHPKSIHTVDIDEMPVACVVRDNDRFDLQAVQAFNTSNFPKADSLFKLYYTSINFNAANMKNVTPMTGMAAFARLAMGDINSAKTLARATLNSFPADYVANLAMGIASLQSRDLENARKYLVAAQNVNPDDVMARQYLAQLGQPMRR